MFTLTCIERQCEGVFEDTLYTLTSPPLRNLPNLEVVDSGTWKENSVHAWGFNWDSATKPQAASWCLAVFPHVLKEQTQSEEAGKLGKSWSKPRFKDGTEFTAVPLPDEWLRCEFCPTDLLKDNGTLIIAQPQHWRRLRFMRKRHTVRCGRIEVQGLARFPYLPADWESNLHGSQLIPMILLFNTWGILCGSGRCSLASPTGVDVLRHMWQLTETEGTINTTACCMLNGFFQIYRGPPNPPAESELQDSGLAPSKSLLFFWWPRQKTKWHD